MRRLFNLFASMGIVLVMLSGDLCAQDRVSFSGYGEMHYNAPSDGGISELDFHRLVLGFAYQFNENISFDAELDFEHAFTEPELEFAYVDFFHREALSFRAGVVLMPVGPLNEFHEPPLFYSVERPYVQKYIIPTSWPEPGAGVYGTLADGSLGYRAYVVSGLDASGFSGTDGIRKGRQKGAEAKAENLAVVGRVEYSPTLRVSLGASGYHGGAAQGEPSLGDAAVSIGEVDALVRVAGFDLRLMYVHTFVADADSISRNGSSRSTVGEEMRGATGEVAYHLGRQVLPDGERDLVLFARFEDFDTNHKVPDGFMRDLTNDRQVLTAGVSFLPISEVALKADVEFWEDGAGGKWEQVNVGIGFMY